MLCALRRLRSSSLFDAFKHAESRQKIIILARCTYKWFAILKGGQPLRKQGMQ